jgi:hypothetical protein
MEQHYTAGTVMALLQTDYVTPITKQVLEERMAYAGGTPLFFDGPAFEVLSIVCDLLVAQDSHNRIVNIASFIDQRLKENTGDGWRYNNMPTDKEMYVNGLKGINENSTLLFKVPFIQLSKDQQLELLQSLQEGAEGAVWKELPSKRFFEELLAEVTEIFYSHPLVQEEMGYVGMADAKGWTRIGLNERDGIEPEALGDNKNYKAS